MERSGHGDRGDNTKGVEGIVSGLRFRDSSGQVQGLLELLPQEGNGWIAAKLLGHIGLASAEVIEALREMVTTRKNSSHWSAMALGAFGDDEFLLELARHDETASSLAAEGITGAAPRPLWPAKGSSRGGPSATSRRTRFQR